MKVGDTVLITNSIDRWNDSKCIRIITGETKCFFKCYDYKINKKTFCLYGLKGTAKLINKKEEGEIRDKWRVNRRLKTIKPIVLKKINSIDSFNLSINEKIKLTQLLMELDQYIGEINKNER